MAQGAMGPGLMAPGGNAVAALNAAVLAGGAGQLFPGAQGAAAGGGGGPGGQAFPLQAPVGQGAGAQLPVGWGLGAGPAAGAGVWQGGPAHGAAGPGQWQVGAPAACGGWPGGQGQGAVGPGQQLAAAVQALGAHIGMNFDAFGNVVDGGAFGQVGAAPDPPALAPRLGTWVDPSQVLAAATAGHFKPGNFVEVVTYGQEGILDGTALFKIEGCYTPSEDGLMLEVKFRGASSIPRAVEFSMAFSPDSPSRGVVHLCAIGGGQCVQQPIPNRGILHVDAVRMRRLEDLEESWIKLEAEDIAVPSTPDSISVQEKKIAELKQKLKDSRAQSPHDRLVRSMQKRSASAATGKKKKKKHKKEDASDSEDSSSSSEEMPLFGGGPANSKTVRDIAQAHPGALFENGLQEIGRQMGLGGTGPDGRLNAEALQGVRLVPYLVNRILPRFPRVNPHTAKELRTNCEALDLLMEGKPAFVADIIMQRIKAIESNLGGKSWKLASQQELVEQTEGLTSLSEELTMAKQQLQHLKLEEAEKKGQKRDDG